MDVSSGMPRSTIELKPGEVRPDVNIALTRALAIEGRMFDHRDQPMAEVEVNAYGPMVPPCSRNARTIG